MTETPRDDRFSDPSIESVNKLFASLSRERFEHVSRDSDIEKGWWVQYVIAEMVSLREEILEIKRREIVSERYVSGGIATLFLAYSKNIITSPELLILPIFFSVFGFVRFREYQRNIFEIDSYLREIEETARTDRGWVSTFFSHRSMARYFESRLWFWLVLLVFSISLFISAKFFGYMGTDLTIFVRT